MTTIRDSAIYSRCRELQTEKDTYKYGITEQEIFRYFGQFKELKDRKPDEFHEEDTNVVFVIDLGKSLTDDQQMMSTMVIQNHARLDDTLDLDSLPVTPGKELKDELLNHMEVMLTYVFTPVFSYLQPNEDPSGKIAIGTICGILAVLLDDPREVILMIRADQTQDPPFEIIAIIRKDRT